MITAKSAANYFERNFFKLMNNAIFEKTIREIPGSKQENEEGITWFQNQTSFHITY